ncbi:MerR family transcriptional regulator [Phaeobacter sp. B1627]|uniref:MerR family transcriptional regulator n=1 Tax=Phaeobacter sp. B1627 TaxID=2583809 RepID=UPI00111BBF40|nr:MerR family transcriptional regulator [Phaeobacter sp. B1627]TNJ44034.1 MerR family transcriptional regulator [Phaeobacter sp. B1627]
MSKSPDAFRTISEVADWLEIQAHVLRFWESKFTQVKPVKRAGGRRYYRPNDMLLLGGIQHLLHEEGLSIKDTQALIRDKGVQHVQSLSKPLEADEAEDLDGPPAPVSKWADQPDGAEPAPKVQRRSPADRDPPEERASASRRLPPLAPPLSAAQQQIPPSLSDFSEVPKDNAAPAKTAVDDADHAASDAAPFPLAGEIEQEQPATPDSASLGMEPPAEDGTTTPPVPTEPASAEPAADADSDLAPPAPGSEQMAMPMDLPDAAAPDREMRQPSALQPAGGGIAPDAAGTAEAQQDFFAAPSVDDMPADADDMPLAPLSDDITGPAPQDAVASMDPDAEATDVIADQTSHFPDETPTAEAPDQIAQDDAAFGGDAADPSDEPAADSPDASPDETPTPYPATGDMPETAPGPESEQAPDAGSNDGGQEEPEDATFGHTAPTDDTEAPALPEAEAEAEAAPMVAADAAEPAMNLAAPDFPEEPLAGSDADGAQEAPAPEGPAMSADAAPLTDPTEHEADAFEEAAPADAEQSASAQTEDPRLGTPEEQEPLADAPAAEDAAADAPIAEPPIADEPVAEAFVAEDHGVEAPSTAESDAGTTPQAGPLPDATDAEPVSSDPALAAAQEGPAPRARVIEIADEVTVESVPGLLRRLSALPALSPDMRSQLSEIAEDLRNTLSRG